MIPLIAKLLLLFGLPVTIAVFGQRRLRAHWNILALASLAYIAYYAAIELLKPITSQFSEVLDPVAVLNHQWALRISIQASLAIIKEGVRWLILRYAAKVPFIAKKIFLGRMGSCLGSRTDVSQC